MPIPAGVESVTVTDGGVPLTGPDGTPLNGHFTVTGPDLATVAQDDFLFGGSARRWVSGGRFDALTLVATDATGISPTGFSYTVVFTPKYGREWTRYFQLPKTSPAVVLADILIPDPVAGSYTVLADPSTLLAKAANLSDLANPATARSSLGLGDAATRNVGTTTGTVAAGNDSRLSDSRTPTAHAATHAAAGSDPVTLSQSQITGLPAALSGMLPLAGGTMTGDLVLNDSSPDTANSAAPKTYVDTGLAGKASTGTQVIAGTGLTGGGSLAADRTLTVAYGATAGTAVQGSEVPFTAGLYSPSRRLPKWPQPSLVLTTFQSGHGFTNNAGSTYTANDTSDFILGTQAAKIVTGGTAAAANVSKTGMAAFDTTGKTVRLLLKVDDITHVTGINLFLGNTSFANTYKWIIQGGAAGSNLITSGEWVTVTLGFHDATTTGTPARSGLTDVRLQITDDGTAPVTAHYQSVELIPDASSVFPNGLVSICFDDCWQSVWDLAKPRLDQYRYPASMYTIQDMVGVSTRLTLAELYHLQDRCGWEIASHAYTDADHALSYTGMTAAQLDSDLRALKAWTLAQGFRGGDGTAYPLGQYGLTTDSQSTTNVVRRYFNYARTTFSKVKETFPPGDPYRLRAISSISSFSGGYSPTTLTTATTGDLDKAKANASWLILVFHKITTGTVADTSTVLQSDFNAIVDKINANGMQVLPVGDVLKYYG